MTRAIDKLRGLAAGFALELEPGDPPTWVGNADGIPIELSIHPAGDVHVAMSLPPEREGLTVLPEPRVVLFRGSIRTGDARFDERVSIFHRDPRVLTLFDARTRAVILDLARLGVMVSGGAVRWSVSLGDPDVELEEPLHRMLMLARHLGGDLSLADAERLERVRSESGPDQEALERLSAQLRDATSGRAVRLEAGLRLIALFPLEQIARELSLAAPDLAAPIIERVVGVMRRPSSAGSASILEVGGRVIYELGERTPGLEEVILLELVQGLAMVRVPDAFDLLARLCDHSSQPVLEGALKALMLLGEPPQAVMRALSPIAIAHIETIMPRFAAENAELGGGLLFLFFERTEPRFVGRRIEYLGAMIATRDMSLGPKLAKELDTPYDDYQRAVIEALHTLGDLSVIPALKPLTEGIFRSSEIKTAAKNAIAAIRTREGAKSLPGALSLTDGAGPGGLSLPPGDRK